MLGYCQLGPEEQTSVKSNQNSKLFIHENASEYLICETVVIGGKLVKLLSLHRPIHQCSRWVYIHNRSIVKALHSWASLCEFILNTTLIHKESIWKKFGNYQNLIRCRCITFYRFIVCPRKLHFIKSPLNWIDVVVVLSQWAINGRRQKHEYGLTVQIALPTTCRFWQHNIEPCLTPENLHQIFSFWSHLKANCM